MGVKSTLKHIWSFIHRKPNDVDKSKDVKKMVDNRRSKLHWLRSLGKK